MITSYGKSKATPTTKYNRLMSDVRQLKLDLEQMAGLAPSREQEAFFDAADMVKNLLEDHDPTYRKVNP